MSGPVSALSCASNPGATELTMVLMTAGLTRTSVAGSTGELPCFAEMMINVESASPFACNADTIAPID